jgi:methylenetetrahydrofolate dehydrogenase (NADP+)/methenyltetrahydrofolate cyclohydrolase
MKIDGKEIANKLLENLKERVDKLKEKGITPHLYIVTFGKNPQTESYLKQKLLRAGQIGAKITIKRFPVNISADKVYKFIEALNADKEINGIIVQRPLPKQFSDEKMSFAVALIKDVDGFNPHCGFSSPVGLAVIKLIEKTLPNENIYEYLKSKKIAIVGKGITAGKPTIKLFEKLKIKIKIIDSKTKEKKKILKSSDIIISAVGKEIITKDVIKNGVVLIGIGMHTKNGKLKGDYNESEIEKKASFYSPTPGGVGPVNVTMLMKNLVEATENQMVI